MAEQSLQNLEAAIFDRSDCNGCRFNSGFQQSMFDTAFEGSRCTNRECFAKKTEETLESRKNKLEETYQVVRIVRSGDGSTLTPLRADGDEPVGDEQAAACRTCANFGACVSAVPDSLGKTYTEMCFDKDCHSQKVAAYRKQLRKAQKANVQQQAKQPDAQGAETAAEAAPNAATSESGADAAGKSAAAKPVRSTVSTADFRNPIKEYRESIWRAIFHRMALKLPMLQNRMLLLALIIHSPSRLDKHKAAEAINAALGAEIPIGGITTQKLMQSVMALDQAKVGTAFQHLAAHVTTDMPINDVVGFLQALGIKLADHWKVNEKFFDTLTKTELDAVCVEVGLAKAAGAPYASLKNGSKKDFVTAMLKVEGFNYLGAIPRMMRWDSRA
jgi:PRTRC genetic system ParB family protein